MKKVGRAPGMGNGRAELLSQPRKTHHVISSGLFSQLESMRIRPDGPQVSCAL